MKQEAHKNVDPHTAICMPQYSKIKGYAHKNQTYKTARYGPGNDKAIPTANSLRCFTIGINFMEHTNQNVRKFYVLRILPGT